MKRFLFILSLVLSVGFGYMGAVALSSSENPALRSGDPLPENLFIELAKSVNPAVVNVAVSFKLPNGYGYPQDPFFDLFEDFFGVPQRPRQKNQPQGQGTGFIIESDGLIVTNNHVIDGASEVKVQLSNEQGKYYDAVLIGQDARTDIALIKIKSSRKNFPIVKLGSSKDVQVGQWVAAFGNPYGHTFSMSKGIISAIGRHIKEINAIPFLQTDASINPGNSGGPLVNTKGEVIGVNSAIDARAQGIGFAIPIDYVKELIPQLKNNGKVLRGYIGVSLEEITPRVKQYLKLPVDSGTIIMSIMDGSPAEKGGLEPYDVIVEFNGKPVENSLDLSDAVGYTKIGDTVKVVVYRGNKKLTKEITVAAQPEIKRAWRQSKNPSLQPKPDARENSPTALGFKVVDFSQRVAKDMNLSSQAPRKPIIVEVERGSPAHVAGLRPGDQILDVNKQNVNKAADVARLLQDGSNMIRVQNGNQISLIFISL